MRRSTERIKGTIHRFCKWRSAYLSFCVSLCESWMCFVTQEEHSSEGLSQTYFGSGLETTNSKQKTSGSIVDKTWVYQAERVKQKTLNSEKWRIQLLLSFFYVSYKISEYFGSLLYWFDHYSFGLSKYNPNLQHYSFKFIHRSMLVLASWLDVRGSGGQEDEQLLSPIWPFLS